MTKSEKEKRQDAISQILTDEKIDSQEKILRLLISQGHSLTQATLSRDFKEMKVAKTPDTSGGYVYKLPVLNLPQQKPERQGMTSSFTRSGIINIEFAGQFAVIKTPAGYAHGIAQDIDANKIPGVMGTIAGNDTILVLLREGSNKENLITSLKLLFSN